MGVVVAAHHVQLDERIAIKFMLPEGLMNPEAVAYAESDVAAAASHQTSSRVPTELATPEVRCRIEVVEDICAL